jgi:hypothetical protein
MVSLLKKLLFALIPDDGHPTPEGNRHFAELIGDAIDRSGVVP